MMKKRGRTLLVCEGQAEKEEFLKSLVRAFPKLSINIEEDVLVYETNIYQLYDELDEYYEHCWDDDLIFDLPVVLDNRNRELDRSVPKYGYREQYKNIFLIFDYEPHDSDFSFEKIQRMLNKFSSEEDQGKLYLNYPILESYLHDSLPGLLPDQFQTLDVEAPDLKSDNKNEYADAYKHLFAETKVKKKYHCDS